MFRQHVMRLWSQRRKQRLFYRTRNSRLRSFFGFIHKTKVEWGKGAAKGLSWASGFILFAMERESHFGSGRVGSRANCSTSVMDLWLAKAPGNIRARNPHNYFEYVSRLYFKVSHKSSPLINSFLIPSRRSTSPASSLMVCVMPQRADKRSDEEV